MPSCTRRCARRTTDGSIVADLSDYAAVRDLVADLIAEGIGATVRPAIREIVEAVARLINGGTTEVKLSDLATALKLDKSAVSRRVAGAIDAGVLRNLEDRKGRPAKLVLGDPLPGDIEVLPPPEVLQCCSVDEGVKAHTHEFCDMCGEGERADDPLLTVYDEEANALLHRSCWPEWAAARERISRAASGSQQT